MVIKHNAVLNIVNLELSSAELEETVKNVLQLEVQLGFVQAE